MTQAKIIAEPQHLIKLTKSDLTTYGGFQYEVGKTYTFPGKGPICSNGWSHAYPTQPLAELLNPTHADFSEYNVYDALGVVGVTDYDLKVGCSQIVLLHQLPALNPTTEQRVAFAIALSLPVLSEV